MRQNSSGLKIIWSESSSARSQGDGMVMAFRSYIDRYGNRGHVDDTSRDRFTNHRWLPGRYNADIDNSSKDAWKDEAIHNIHVLSSSMLI